MRFAEPSQYAIDNNIDAYFKHDMDTGMLVRQVPVPGKSKGYSSCGGFVQAGLIQIKVENVIWMIHRGSHKGHKVLIRSRMAGGGIDINELFLKPKKFTLPKDYMKQYFPPQDEAVSGAPEGGSLP